MELRKYYSGRLDSAERSACGKLADAMEQGRESVSLSLSFAKVKDSMDRIFRTVQCERPELFFVDFTHINYAGSLSSVIVYPRYRPLTAPLEVMRDRISREIERIVSEASREAAQSEQSKCRWIHNYLLKNVRYHWEALRRPQDFPEAYSIDGAFLNGAAVCDGISKAFQILCQRLGLSAMTVRGASTLPQNGAGASQPHAWNVVSIRGNPVHVDATWDNNLSESTRHTRYDYFCVPDAWIRRDHSFTDAPPCVTDKFSYFAAKNVRFSSPRELKAYLEEALRQQNGWLYFQLDVERPPPDFVSKVNAMVRTALDQSGQGNCGFDCSVNPQQRCFFYRITQKSPRLIPPNGPWIMI